MQDQIKLEPEYIGTKRKLQLEYIGNWVWRAVSSLIDIKDFKPSPKWIANRLGTSVDEVILALIGLQKLGIIKKTETGYEKLLRYDYFSDCDLDRKTVQEDHVLISTQVLARLNPLDPNTGSFYRTGFVATNRELATKYFTKVENILKEFLMESANSNSDAVFALSFSGVNIIEKQNEGPVQ